MSRLRDIQPFVQDITEVISAALKVGVEIVDDDLLRLGGTGLSKKLVGTKMTHGHINRWVLQTKKSYTLSTPGEDDLCTQCLVHRNCHYVTAGYFMPIMLNGKPIGLINLVSFDQAQKEILLNNQQSYLEFVDRIAKLLASKVSEHQMVGKLQVYSDLLTTTVNAVEVAMIVTDAEGEVRYINRSAETLLGIEPASCVGRLVGEVLSNSPLPEVLKTGQEVSEKVLTYTTPTGKIRILTTAKPVWSNGRISGAVETFRLTREVQRTADKLLGDNPYSSFDEIIGNSKAILEVKEKAKKVAKSNSTVLIESESGTGKELFARAIHAESDRAGKPFRILNCSAIPETLLESELFGYEEGSFTGARRGGKVGKFELADGGTIFLDEIGEMPLYLQAKLLRFLQHRTFERVGGTKEVTVDVRVIAATNRNLAKMVANGEFREDLYYRLCVIPLHIPPLRERKEDIPILSFHFLRRYSKLLNKSLEGFSPEAMELLVDYHWPGNVRELENVIEYAANFETCSIITSESLPAKITESSGGVSANPGDKTLKEILLETEKEMLKASLMKHGVSTEAKKKIAQELGLSIASLYRKLKEHGICTKFEK